MTARAIDPYWGAVGMAVAAQMKPGASTTCFPGAAASGGGRHATSPAPFLSPFLHADSHPTEHEWCAAVTDPSRHARHLPADCDCGRAALLNPFHFAEVPHA